MGANASKSPTGERSVSLSDLLQSPCAEWPLSLSRLKKSPAPSAHQTESEDEESDREQENVCVLPSKLDPLGRKVRRIVTNGVDEQEELLLVKRRALVAQRQAQHKQKQTTLTPDGSKKHPNCSMSAKDFEYLKVIGTGGMGKVILVRNVVDRKLYAMKVFSRDVMHNEDMAEKVLSERDVMGGTNHHALVHLRWAFQSSKHLFLVMEYCPGGEIALHLHKAGRFSEQVTAFYAAEIVLAVEHLHRHGIIYRDLKPENLLLTASGHVKLADFGISKFGITESTAGAKTLCGSYEYLAPEVLHNTNGYGTAVDWWSFGVVLYEMLTGIPPWYHRDPRKMRKRILSDPLEIPSFVSKEAASLIRLLLVIDPHKRLGSANGSLDIKRHAFFRRTDWEMVMFRETNPPLRPCSSEESIEQATNFDEEFRRLSIDSFSDCSDADDFEEFDFEAPIVTNIEYQYSRI